MTRSLKSLGLFDIMRFEYRMSVVREGRLQ